MPDREDYREQWGSVRLAAIHAVIARACAIVGIDHFLMPEVFDVFDLSRTLAVD